MVALHDNERWTQATARCILGPVSALGLLLGKTFGASNEK